MSRGEGEKLSIVEVNCPAVSKGAWWHGIMDLCASASLRWKYVRRETLCMEH
jgi:hypothetical protein